MDVDDISLKDLKKYRPDLYLDMKQEVCFGELGLTKDDLIFLTEPLSDTIKDYLRPYLPKLSRMTYNDIVDLENDIVDEISEQLLDIFEEIEHNVYKRPNTLIKRDLERTPKKKIKSKEEVISENIGVKKGDAIRWNYTKEEGIVVGFENEGRTINIIVRRFDGTKVLFENDPRLFTILEGEEKDEVISKRERYLIESKERKDIERDITPPKRNKTKTIYDGILYNEPTRRGSKLKVGDSIRFKLTKGIGVVKGFMRRGGLDRIIMNKTEGVPESIIDNPAAYDIVSDKSLNEFSADNNDCSDSEKSFDGKKNRSKADIGDWILWKPTGDKGKVIDFKNVGPVQKLVLSLRGDCRMEVYDNPLAYDILLKE